MREKMSLGARGSDTALTPPSSPRSSPTRAFTIPGRRPMGGGQLKPDTFRGGGRRRRWPVAPNEDSRACCCHTPLCVCVHTPVRLTSSRRDSAPRSSSRHHLLAAPLRQPPQLALAGHAPPPQRLVLRRQGLQALPNLRLLLLQLPRQLPVSRLQLSSARPAAGVIEASSRAPSTQGGGPALPMCPLPTPLVGAAPNHQAPGPRWLPPSPAPSLTSAAAAPR